MKMSVATMFSQPGSNFDKVDDALLLLKNVSFSTGNTSQSNSNFPLSRNENQNNGANVAALPPFDFTVESSFDPEVVYTRVLKIRRNGRVSKKSVKIYTF